MSEHGPKANTSQINIISCQEKRHDSAQIGAQPEHGYA
jgi:hypothetical protein